HFRAEDLDGIRCIRRSKYFQSDTRLTMRHAKEDLKKGLFVLYSGTGCQIAGLKAFLGKSYDNLVTCEVVCHGVPSRKVWKKYREEKEQREGKTIEDLVFRDKSAGWSHNQYKITYKDGTIEKEASPKQMFHAGYLKGIFYRPSCGTCRWAALPRTADITLADFWKYQGKFRKSGADLGVSLITVNSAKGSKLLQESSQYLKVEETSRELSLKSCRHLDNHPKENPNRSAFFDLFFKEGYYVSAEKLIIDNRNKNIFVRVLRKLYRPLKNMIGK
nr:Coenzyme F420 hydrogenase/dehydrogenase, beta subunit C-terminal domain [Eubacterium sp.]